MVVIDRAIPERVPYLAELLGKAFVDDPMIVWPFGADRLDVVTEFFRVFDEGIAANGWLWEAGAGDGVAAWIPPGSDAEMMDIDRALRHMLEGAQQRHGELWGWIAERFPDEPFWYLDHIAVEADQRGSGVGTALIEHGLAFARNDDVTAFLETGVPVMCPTTSDGGSARTSTRPPRTAALTSGSCASIPDGYFSGTPRLSAKRLTSSVCSW